jgi:hypothetical protein
MSDAEWICQKCFNVTAARAEDETMYVSWRQCLVCGKMTKHKTIIPDESPVMQAQRHGR